MSLQRHHASHAPTPARPTFARGTIACDVAALITADATTIDALAQLAFTLRRLGFQFRLRHASDELLELIELVGLGAVLAVEPVGQAEEQEQPLRIEEERELGDYSR